jgi:hypothetical protein
MGPFVRGLRLLPLLALALGSSLTARTPGQEGLAAEGRLVIETVSRRPEDRGIHGEWVNVTYHGVPPQGTNSTVRFLVDGGPDHNTIAMPVDLVETAVLGPFISGQTIYTASAAQPPSTLDLLKNYALRCVRLEAGMQPAFRF